MSDDDEVTGFLEAFRASQRPFTIGTEPCAECGELATTYCESCRAGLCDDHADSEQYDDVDVCKDVTACGERIEAAEKRNTN